MAKYRSESLATQQMEEENESKIVNYFTNLLKIIIIIKTVIAFANNSKWNLKKRKGNKEI